MGSKDQKQGGGFFSSIASSISNFGTAMHKSVNGLIGYEGLEVINPEGGTEDAEEEAQRGRWKQEDRDSYWKMMQTYIGSDVTSMVTLPVLIFEPMTMIQKVAEMLEYSHLLDLADECEDPYMWMVYATSRAISVYYAYQRTWKPFNPILDETYGMVNHGGITFLAEQLVPHLAEICSRYQFQNEQWTFQGGHGGIYKEDCEYDEGRAVVRMARRSYHSITDRERVQAYGLRAWCSWSGIFAVGSRHGCGSQHWCPMGHVQTR